MSHIMTIARWAALTPSLSYAVASCFYELIGPLGWFQKYRRELADKGTKKNSVSQAVVLRHVIVYHIVLSSTALVLNEFFPSPTECKDSIGSFEKFCQSIIQFAELEDQTIIGVLSYLARLAYLVQRQFFSLVIMDTWTFWVHYLMHKNKWFFRKIHAVHHQLIVPFSYGASYNHWAESVFADCLAGLLAVHLANLTDAEQIFFYSVVTIKAVDDHSGYELPFGPSAALGRLTGCTRTFHYTHHQHWGHQSNFSTYFTWWDRLMGTTYNGPRTIKWASAARSPDHHKVGTGLEISARVDEVSPVKKRKAYRPNGPLRIEYQD
ncbi:hypothetical protein BX600DRAFT_506804 [Xylariales sp. PMI_506]|nr:hypothetical protein BX600DRAFT_506804 [Xylariales sp. PMI_506]